MGAAAIVQAPPRLAPPAISHRIDSNRSPVVIAAELCRGSCNELLSAELIALQRGCMRIRVAGTPPVGGRVLAHFSACGRPLGMAAGYVLACCPQRGVTIGFHDMGPRIHELIDDLVRLRPSLRAQFLAAAIDAHVRIS